MELWNTRTLHPPCATKHRATLKAIDLKVLRQVMSEGVHFFTQQEKYHFDTAILTKMLYRIKFQFRNTTDFMALKRLESAYRRSQIIDIDNVLQNFLNQLPSERQHNWQMHIPSRNLLNYVLVRLQSLGRILCRVVDTGKNAFIKCNQRIQLGHFWKMALILYSVSARITVLAEEMCKYTCKLYGLLLPFVNKLGTTKVPWLPPDYILPPDLQDWLGVEWFDPNLALINLEQVKVDLTESFMQFAADDDDDVEEVGTEVAAQNPVIIDLLSTFNERGTVDDCFIDEGFPYSVLPVPMTEPNPSVITLDSTENSEYGEVVCLDTILESPPTIQSNVQRKKKLQRKLGKRARILSGILRVNSTVDEPTLTACSLKGKSQYSHLQASGNSGKRQKSKKSKPNCMSSFSSLVLHSDTHEIQPPISSSTPIVHATIKPFRNMTNSFSPILAVPTASDRQDNGTLVKRRCSILESTQKRRRCNSSDNASTRTMPGTQHALQITPVDRPSSTDNVSKQPLTRKQRRQAYKAKLCADNKSLHSKEALIKRRKERARLNALDPNFIPL